MAEPKELIRIVTLAQKEKLELMVKEEIEIAKHRIETLKNEISEFAHQCEKLEISQATA